MRAMSKFLEQAKSRGGEAASGLHRDGVLDGRARGAAARTVSNSSRIVVSRGADTAVADETNLR